MFNAATTKPFADNALMDFFSITIWMFVSDQSNNGRSSFVEAAINLNNV